MTVDELERANRLLSQIKEVQKNIALYQETASFAIRVVDPKQTLQVLSTVWMKAEEIREPLIAVLEGRLKTMRDQLQLFGIEE
jgi:hypothetical protein